jgi:D-alanyl-D-alanine carboxypeptidase (penicillin-binding protein 5/6)
VTALPLARGGARRSAWTAAVLALVAVIAVLGSAVPADAAAVAAAAVEPAAAAPAPPAIAAGAAIVVQPDTGDIVYARNADEPLPVASTTKLMTALLTLEHAALSDVFTAVRYRAQPAESVMGLREGERLTVADLLRGLLLASANDAAFTLAHDVAGSRRAFVAMMNARAQELGLSNTHYANSIGLDQAGNYSSAADLVKLALILRQRSFVRRVTDRPRVVLRTGARRREIVNRNSLVREVPWMNGVKTGHTEEAGYVLVGSATRNGVTLVSAVLDDPTEAARDADTLALLRYGASRYRRVTVLRQGRELSRATISHQDNGVPLVPARTVERVVRRGERVTTMLVSAPSKLTGPVARGAQVGTIVVRQRGKVVASVPLVTSRAVPKATLTQRLGWLGSLAIVVAALCSLPLALLRRRTVRRRRRRAREAREAEIA